MVAPGAPGRAGGGWILVALIADDGQEPAAHLSDRAALAAWCAVSALWHPALLAQARELPRIENVDYPSSPGPNEVRVLAEGMTERLPSGYLTQVEDAGTVLKSFTTIFAQITNPLAIARIDGAALHKGNVLAPAVKNMLAYCRCQPIAAGVVNERSAVARPVGRLERGIVGACACRRSQRPPYAGRNVQHFEDAMGRVLLPT